MPFRFERLSIPEVVLVKPVVFRDERGFFLETFKESAFASCGLPWRFVQDNLSHSTHGVLRGLHYQKPPAAQGKLVMAPKGEVFDVAVDIRTGSPDYGRWVATVLSEENLHSLYIPPGFAHGFCVLSGEADLLYKVSAQYEPALDAGILWNDPSIGIEWPVDSPLLSPKDATLPLLRDTEADFVFEAS
jgi:dTDP-4-dehydrorhamnose 3,5-epimerase